MYAVENFHYHWRLFENITIVVWEYYLKVGILKWMYWFEELLKTEN